MNLASKHRPPQSGPVQGTQFSQVMKGFSSLDELKFGGNLPGTWGNELSQMGEVSKKEMQTLVKNQRLPIQLSVPTIEVVATWLNAMISQAPRLSPVSLPEMLMNQNLPV